MLSLYRTLSLRYLRQRWSRAVLIVASIALGVATWVATGALNQSLSRAVRQAATPLGGAADLYVSNGKSGVNRTLAKRLDEAQIPGVSSVRPLVVERVQVMVPNDKGEFTKGPKATLLGIDFKTRGISDAVAWGVCVNRKTLEDYARKLKEYHKLKEYLAAQIPPVKEYVAARLLPVLVGQKLDETLDQSSSKNDIRILAAGTSHDLKRVGPIDASGPLASLGGSTLVTDCDAAAQLLSQPGLVTRLDISLEPGADREEVRQRIQEELVRDSRELRPEYLTILAGSPQAGFPANVPWGALGMTTQRNQAQVVTPESQDQRVRDVLLGLEVGFSLCGAAALVVGMFLVYNALAVSVAERRHDIGILRSLGATRGQVRGLFLGEAFFLGLAGTILGVPFGLGLAHFSLGTVQHVLRDIFLPVQARELDVTLGNILSGMGAGLVAALIAALVPASQAAAEEPANAVRRVPPSLALFYRLLHLGSCLALVGAGAAAITWKEMLPDRVGTYGGLVLVLIGTLLATPLLASFLARLLQPLLRRLLKVEGRLAADNLVRSPGRTGLVIAALAAVVALVFQTAGVIDSNKVAIEEWIEQRIPADMFVTSGGPISASGQNLPMKDNVLDDLKKEYPGVREVPICFSLLDWQRSGKDTKIQLIVFDAAGYYEINHARDSSKPQIDLFRRLSEQPGTAIVSENFALMNGVREGDTLTLPGATGPVQVRVIGSIVDYTWNRGTVLVHRSGPNIREFDAQLADAFHLYLPADLQDEAETVRRRVQQSDWGTEHALYTMTRGEFRQHILGMVERLYGLAYTQYVVVGVVALLGVVTALLISVLQRRRELGLLRALGATRAQVVRSVLAEALLMGLIGAVIGVLVGLPLEWYVVKVIIFDEAGFDFPFRVPWLAAGLVAGLAMVLAAVAGLGPALHAMRLRIPEAIACE